MYMYLSTRVECVLFFHMWVPVVQLRLPDMESTSPHQPYTWGGVSRAGDITVEQLSVCAKPWVPPSAPGLGRTQWLKSSQAEWLMPPVTEQKSEHRTGGSQRFEASLGHTVSSRLVRAAQRDPVSNN